MSKKLVIVPAYNEEDNIADVIQDLKMHTPEYDIVVIDDGSTDATGEVARDCGVKVIRLPFNLGIGAAVQTGYKYAMRENYTIAVQFDADGQHLASQIPLIASPVIDSEADFVVGSRFLSDSDYKTGRIRAVGISVLSSVLSLFTGHRITDPTSGFRAANRGVIEFFSRYYPDDYPEPESLLLLYRAGFRVKEVPVIMRQRQAGESSITPVRAVYYMIKVLLAIFIDMFKKVP